VFEYAFDTGWRDRLRSRSSVILLHRQQSEVPAGTARRHCLVSVRVKEDGDSGGRRSVLRCCSTI